jgi:hypothetical protein
MAQPVVRSREDPVKAAKSLVLNCIGALGYGLVAVPTPRPNILRRVSRMWTDEHPIVRTAKLHLNEATIAPGLPSLGRRWGAYAARLRSRIKAVKTPEELILLGQSGDAGVEKHFDRTELMAICEASDLQMHGALPPHLYDAMPSFRSPKHVPSSSSISYRGRTLDFVTAGAANAILQILSIIGEPPRTVCDIGGGTGKYAMAWLTNSAHQPDLVVIIDLPETLVYSEALLRTELGGGRVQYITSEETIPSRTGVVLCPVAYTRALQPLSFDLVTNKGSMQEMTDEWIDWYMAFLDRQECRFFWSSNYFASALSNMHEGHNAWSARPSPLWQMIHSEISLSTRSNLVALFRKEDGHCEPSDRGRRGADGWLGKLEHARCRRDEASLRGAIDFARSDLPFVPKEAWQAAKMLAELTHAPDDKRLFGDLDAMRRSGIEALYF